ncbi:WXG100 family type VII secretion target, partial [Saccharothrix coeruleofusca]|uniref:WXG100 family type VII secretion target n=1 Tax=Saccharothrix coeruleofusca TaxID=33919 RepID=UPI0035712075
DQLMGDPDEINANVEATKTQAAELRVLAEDHRNGLTQPEGWTGQSSEAFQKNMEAMGKELDSLANAVEQKAKIVAICGMLVQVLRDIVRDMIAQFLGSLLAGAIAAAAAAFFTFGASIAGFIGYAVGKAVALGVNIGSRIARLIAALGRQMSRIKNLDDITDSVGKGWQRFENIADVAEVGYEAWKAQEGVDRKIDKALAQNGQNGPAATATATADNTVRAPDAPTATATAEHTLKRMDA